MLTPRTVLQLTIDAMKRKAEHVEDAVQVENIKRQAVSHPNHFREGLLEHKTLEEYKKSYADSVP